MVDFVGNEIQVGDRVAYATRHRSSLELKQLVVTEVSDNFLAGHRPEETVNARKIRLTVPDYIVKLGG